MIENLNQFEKDELLRWLLYKANSEVYREMNKRFPLHHQKMYGKSEEKPVQKEEYVVEIPQFSVIDLGSQQRDKP